MTRKRLIKIVPSHPGWPVLFKKEALLVKQALGDNCIEVNHIDSAAASGLAANKSMLALGYEAKGEYGIPLRRYFQKGGNNRTHHVHVFEIDNPEIERHLTFRDWMRQNKDDREQYEKIKRHLASMYPHDITSYTQGKDKFIADINKKLVLLPLNYQLTPTLRDTER
ncbi:MAG: GrpB family protein [Gammaproteobacteria bacterium]|nr:GrpB family protein [Gammaproteobacteria bacterium]MCH9718148.1 GrpB family protein [Gammaproteobacteria bacterium]MCH9762834.1 GrpB family protein [Gammaproteobacteria bacterium]